MKKLEGLKVILKDKNHDTYGCLTAEKNQVVSEISIIDSMEESGDMLPNYKIQRISMKGQLHYFTAKKETLKDGDINSLSFTVSWIQKEEKVL